MHIPDQDIKKLIDECDVAERAALLIELRKAQAFDAISTSIDGVAKQLEQLAAEVSDIARIYRFNN